MNDNPDSLISTKDLLSNARPTCSSKTARQDPIPPRTLINASSPIVSRAGPRVWVALAGANFSCPLTLIMVWSQGITHDPDLFRVTLGLESCSKQKGGWCQSPKSCRTYPWPDRDRIQSLDRDLLQPYSLALCTLGREGVGGGGGGGWGGRRHRCRQLAMINPSEYPLYGVV